MANTAQAKKRVRQAEKHRQHNMSLRSKMRTSIKKVVKSLDAASKEDAGQALKAAVPIIDSMVNKGIVAKNAAARYKSRLNTRLKKLAEKVY